MLWRRRGKCRQGRRGMDAELGREDTRVPGVEWPHLNHPLPRVVGGGPLRKQSRDRGVAARRELALTVVLRLALLAAVTTTSTGGRRVWQVAV